MKGGIFIPYVPVPKDLTTVKTKVAFNLTKRQLICFGLAAAVAVPTYFLTRGALGNNMYSAIMNQIKLDKEVKIIAEAEYKHKTKTKEKAHNISE